MGHAAFIDAPKKGKGRPTIDDRQRELAAWVFDIWRLPGESAPKATNLVDTPGAVGSDVDPYTDELPDVPE
jgi:hypothetical protein